MSTWFTARMRSPTCRPPHRSAGEPGIVISQVQRMLGKCVARDQILGQYLKLLKFAKCIFSSLTPETSPGKLWEIFL